MDSAPSNGAVEGGSDERRLRGMPEVVTESQRTDLIWIPHRTMVPSKEAVTRDGCVGCQEQSRTISRW